MIVRLHKEKYDMAGILEDRYGLDVVVTAVKNHHVANAIGAAGQALGANINALIESVPALKGLSNA